MNFDEEISLQSLNKILDVRIKRLLSTTEEFGNRKGDSSIFSGKFNSYSSFSQNQQRRAISNSISTNTRAQILRDIMELPTFSQRLSGFLDYLIDFSSFLHQEIWNTQSEIYKTRDELCSAKIPRKKQIKVKRTTRNNDKNIIFEERLNKLSAMLNVKPNDIENKIDSLVALESPSKRPMISNNEREYQRCLSLVSGDVGALSFIIGDMQQKIKRTHSIHNYTKDLFGTPTLTSISLTGSPASAQSPKSQTTPTRLSYLAQTQKESPPQLQFITDL